MTPTALHDLAMRHASEADDYRATAQRVAEHAALLECLAVTACELDHPESQPSHAILCRSAAWLLIEAGRAEEAREMVGRGIEGGAPEWAVGELEEVGRAANNTLESKK